MEELVRTGNTSLTALGKGPISAGHPWNYYKGFSMDFAKSVFAGEQLTHTFERGGHQAKCGDTSGSIHVSNSEMDIIFGYSDPLVMANMNGYDPNSTSMFKGNGMNLIINDFYNTDNSSHNYLYSFGSVSVGNPIPVAGMTFDARIMHKAYDGAGTEIHADASERRLCDLQINQIWGCYVNPDNGSYISLMFLPEGDNYGGTAGISDASKYTFRNSNDTGEPGTHHLHNKGETHFEKYGRSQTITCVRDSAARVPKGYLFMGFDISLWIGEAQNTTGDRYKILNITNLRVHDERAVTRWHELGRNYGDPSVLGNYESVIPKLVTKDGHTRESPWDIQKYPF